MTGACIARRAHNAYGVIRRLALASGGAWVDLGIGCDVGVSADNRERLSALRHGSTYGVIRRLALASGGAWVDLGIGCGAGVSADNRERLSALRHGST